MLIRSTRSALKISRGVRNRRTLCPSSRTFDKIRNLIPTFGIAEICFNSKLQKPNSKPRSLVAAFLFPKRLRAKFRLCCNQQGRRRMRDDREQLNGEEITELPEMGSEEVGAVEEILGYTFREKRLLWEALTHPSFYYPYKGTITYERLEFVGDAILNSVVANWVFSTYPDLAPGPLTRLRSANVNTEQLARVAVSRNLHLYIRHKAPNLNEQIEEFMNALKVYPNNSVGLLDPPKVLADVVESLLGAIFIDSDSSSVVWEAFKKVAEPLIDLKKLESHPMAELHELCQKKKLDLEIVKDAWETKMYIEVRVNGTIVGSAIYGNKKEVALNRAAKSALDRLKELNDLLELTASSNYRYYRFKEKLSKLWSRLPSPAWFLSTLVAAGILHQLIILSTGSAS